MPSYAKASAGKVVNVVALFDLIDQIISQQMSDNHWLSNLETTLIKVNGCCKAYGRAYL